MADFIYTISKQKLIDITGKDYRSVLQSLLKTKVITSVTEYVQIVFPKHSATHIQSIMEFIEENSGKRVSTIKANLHKHEDKE